VSLKKSNQYPKQTGQLVFCGYIDANQVGWYL